MLRKAFRRNGIRADFDLDAPTEVHADVSPAGVTSYTLHGSASPRTVMSIADLLELF